MEITIRFSLQPLGASVQRWDEDRADAHPRRRLLGFQPCFRRQVQNLPAAGLAVLGEGPTDRERQAQN